MADPVRRAVAGGSLNVGGRHYNRNYRNWARPTSGGRRRRDAADVVRAELARPPDGSPPNPADGAVSRFVAEWVDAQLARVDAPDGRKAPDG